MILTAKNKTDYGYFLVFDGYYDYEIHREHSESLFTSSEKMEVGKNYVFKYWGVWLLDFVEMDKEEEEKMFDEKEII